ncbi:MAG TPA: hypothetical protein VG269_21420 [Tepidisphaeraceae bacterium]|jgi:hypothetical protein|nr:hypothetical protein [Tepidisphaeraceae bacterium]
MGDCAIIIFHSEQQLDVSPAVYLHAHGGCVLATLEMALSVMKTTDAGYSCARFIGCCSQTIPPNNSLGVQNIPGTASDVGQRNTPEHYQRLMEEAQKFDWGGRGTFLVDVDRWQVRHAGSCSCDYGDIEDGFGLQEFTELKSIEGIVQLPADKAGT